LDAFQAEDSRAGHSRGLRYFSSGEGQHHQLSLDVFSIPRRARKRRPVITLPKLSFWCFERRGERERGAGHALPAERILVFSRRRAREEQDMNSLIEVFSWISRRRERGAGHGFSMLRFGYMEEKVM
jgi:hypothetical protein